MSKIDCSCESWKSVVGYKNYEISNHGRVRRIDGVFKVLLKLSYTARGGYARVNLNNTENIKTWRVHRLVLLAFVGECTGSGMQARHLDGNPKNNRLDNLAWGTVQENSDDRKLHGTRVSGDRHGMARMTGEMARNVNHMYETGRSILSIAETIGVHYNTVYHIVSGRTWTKETGVERRLLRCAPRATFGN
jgi:hypothetical protein